MKDFDTYLLYLPGKPQFSVKCLSEAQGIEPLVREETDLRQKLHKVNLCGRIKRNEKKYKILEENRKKNTTDERLKGELI